MQETTKLEPNPQNVRSQLLSYIDGILSPDERERYEQRLLTDEFFCSQVDDAEFLLIEAFAEGSLPPAERTVVAAWIENSPERRAQAAITSALLHDGKLRTTQPKSRRRFLALSLYAAAACIAGLAAITALHPWRQASVEVARVQPPIGPKPVYPAPQPPASGTDTILLEAYRLRGIANPDNAPRVYTVSAGKNVRIQIMVPRETPANSYSVQLVSTNSSQMMRPVQEDALSVIRTGSIAYVEFSLPTGSLLTGSYSVQLQSREGSYSIAFSVVAKS